MQAIILAGGRGTRLKPYTISFPKPLMPIGQHPILEIIIRQLVHFGFDRISISTGYLAEIIEAYFRDGQRFGTKIEYVREPRPLNTAGALKLCENCEENFLVMNGDILTSLDYGQLLRNHIQKMAAATIATKIRENKVDFGVLHHDEQGTLVKYIEKPVYTFNVSMGVYALSKKCIDFIHENESLGMPDLLMRLKDAGEKVVCQKSNCYWLDIGRVDDYEKAQEEFEANQHLFLNANE